MTACLMEGCERDGELHHALRNRHPFNQEQAGRVGSGKWRERPEFVQRLCREHHFETLHQIFSRSGNWPAGWGFADTPLLRGEHGVERMIARAATRMPEGRIPSASDGMAARRSAGGFANAVLYRMCRENPAHDDVGIVEAKIRLVGDHYRASLKRGIGRHHVDDGDGFFVELAREIRASDLDSRLSEMRLEGRVNLRTLPLAVGIHEAFERTVVSFTRSWQGPNAERRVTSRRSFCSKYLHFHAPEAFFIYDSVVLRRLGLGGTTTYGRFADTILRYALSGGSDAWTTRSVDMEIYGYDAPGAD